MKHFYFMILLLFIPIWTCAQESSFVNSRDHGIWNDRPEVLKDYIRFMRERTPYIEVFHDYRERSNEDSERLVHARMLFLNSSQLFYFAEAEHWSYQKKALVTGLLSNQNQLTAEEQAQTVVNPDGNKNTVRVGVKKETENASEMEFWLVQHQPITGAEVRFSSFWEPWHWDIQGAYQIPWKATITSRVLEGSIQRGILSLTRIWREGRWRLHSETAASRYQLALIPSFYTLEQTQELVLTRSWFIGTRYGLGYSIERAVVEHPQAPIIVPDLLNHALHGSVEHEFFSGFSTSFDLTYQVLLLSDSTAMTILGEATYEPTEKQKYWFSFESGKSSQLEEGSRDETEIHWKAGVQYNW
ncbi:MAG: hypothetical protein HQM13_01765 [SAR324 cluster bacterium]|nr:hypothetical protein [SAR324 cluster bacterium]